MMEIALSSTANWYCAITRPGSQRRVELELFSLGFRTFTPKTRKWVSHARVRKAVERPLLSRYLFVEIDHPRQSFGAVCDVYGVDAFISNQGAPCRFPRDEVEDLLRRQMSGEWDEVAKGKLAVGARIRVMEGQFEDMLATVTGVKGRKINFKILDSRTNGSALDVNVRAA